VDVLWDVDDLSGTGDDLLEIRPGDIDDRPGDTDDRPVSPSFPDCTEDRPCNELLP